MLHWVIAAAAERMTSKQPHRRHPHSTQRAVSLHSFLRIFRASRDEAARWRQHRRDCPLVSPQDLQHNEFWKLAHESSSGSRLSACGTSPWRDLACHARFPCQLPFYNYESAAHFVHYLREVDDQQRLLRIDHHVRAYFAWHSAKSNCFAQTALHPVTLHRAAEGAAHGESDARAGGRAACRHRFRPQQIERGQRSGKMPPPQFVDALEVGVPQQSRATRKRLRGWHRDT